MKPFAMKIPVGVAEIMKTLEFQGFQAFLVGGCVRDTLLGLTPHDFDVATNAPLEQTKRLFPKTIAIGEQFGITVVVCEDGSSVEVACFRQEHGTADGRHPENVAFVADVTIDLSRRDFTINAMALDLRGNLIDPFGGAEALEQQIIQTVGSPLLRFEEDFLRILRCFRFSAKLGFSIEAATLQAAITLATSLESVSKERIGQEINKLLSSAAPGKTFKLMLDAGIFEKILPELQQLAVKKVAFSSDLAALLDHASPSLRLGVLAFLTGNVVSGEQLKASLKLANAEVALIKNTSLALTLLAAEETSEFSIRRMLSKTSKKLAVLLISCDICNKNVRTLIQKVLDKGACTSLVELKINGDDLLAAGFKGPEIGKKLKEILVFVLENPEQNERKNLLAML
jgi:tRNA nucleotidyltransferase (CCA-adding enzyme)